tara:strand:- start:461 stop:844 length:384 start_codon:yes stop_codon:yes gene_type:complete
MNREEQYKDWERRYRATFRSDDQFCNWLKLPWNDKPVTPKYLKEYEIQLALVAEMKVVKTPWSGEPEDHRYQGNSGKYHEIFLKEQQKIYVRDRAETRRRYSKVTQGHTPSTSKRKKEKRIRREFCD